MIQIFHRVLICPKLYLMNSCKSYLNKKSFRFVFLFLSEKGFTRKVYYSYSCFSRSFVLDGSSWFSSLTFCVSRIQPCQNISLIMKNRVVVILIVWQSCQCELFAFLLLQSFNIY